MQERLLTVSLVPPSVLAIALEQLISQRPEARIALVAPGKPASDMPEVTGGRVDAATASLMEVRRARFDGAVLLHGPDQYATRAYWKGVALILLSGAGVKQFREIGGAGEMGALRAIVGGAAKAVRQMVEEVYVAVFGAALFVPLLTAVAVTDLSEALAERCSGRSAEAPRKR